ncbi:MAG: hypothetical protein GX297_00490, partial [Treponema sp.]|nr:hypothetical protein [Treponema sp.]
FADLPFSAYIKENENKTFERNIYKNYNGSKVWFEEINKNLKLTFRYSWTSSELYGIVRKICIINNDTDSVKIEILDGARNILPACCTADFQNSNSVLLDAYKKTELETDVNLALFTVSSIVTDKAEPNEALYANTCWFSCKEDILLKPKAPALFALNKHIKVDTETKGCRPSCFVHRQFELKPKQTETWYQVFNTALDISNIIQLKQELKDRKKLEEKLIADIEKGNSLLEKYIAQSDGIQNTNDKMICLHHRQNVLFNIMRGGIFQDDGAILLTDFIKFIEIRNKLKVQDAKKMISDFETSTIHITELKQAAEKTKDIQLMRLVFEYLPLTFSRRHGDPSRPWNKFNIHLKESDGTPVLNYEGNWRDIFQNWEALVWSFPEYAENLYIKFLNAMTADGFNPYRITKNGIDWEEPDLDNPWAQIGYWSDHQVIYLEKLLEFASKKDRKSLLETLNKKYFSTSNVPYRIKTYDEILTNPRETIIFDRKLSESLKDSANILGTDAKLLLNKENQPILVSLASKLLQIVISKMANFVPGGGIWLNTQRPEWNDANNALVGYGLSIVTLCYIYRFLDFLIEMFEESTANEFLIPAEIADCFLALSELYKSKNIENTACNSTERKIFTDSAGKIFEKERSLLYKNAFQNGEKNLRKNLIIESLISIKKHTEFTIKINRRSDMLYHSYNTMKILQNSIEISNMQIMLEGQVAVLSSKLLSEKETLEVLKALPKSSLFEPIQNSYLLYPNKELLRFTSKNSIGQNDIENLKNLLKRTNRIFTTDINGKYHFNGEYRNINILRQEIEKLPEDEKPTSAEMTEIEKIYEQIFDHQNFTGRSGTFFAYEGLGSIYWHMVSKLLLAVQENVLAAKTENEKLIESYYSVRKGLGFNKEPSLYGAFPADPYSHTPEKQGAKQPGMTGQVKEEILTRFGELGVDIKNGRAYFNPTFLQDKEFDNDNKLEFSWCGTKIIYKKSNKPKIFVKFNDNTSANFLGSELDEKTSSTLFSRKGFIKEILVDVLQRN